MQLGEKKLVVQRASVGAKGANSLQAPVAVQVTTYLLLLLLIGVS